MVKKFLHRRERLSLALFGANEQFQRRTNRDVFVDYENDRCKVRDRWQSTPEIMVQ